MTIDRSELVEWCRVPWEELERHPSLRIPLHCPIVRCDGGVDCQ